VSAGKSCEFGMSTIADFDELRNSPNGGLNLTHQYRLRERRYNKLRAKTIVEKSEVKKVVFKHC
jgi:hypothetical protein